MFSHMLKCSDLRVIKQLAIMKGAIRVRRSTGWLCDVHCKGTGSPRGQTGELQKEKGEKRVSKRLCSLHWSNLTITES